uniref:crk-like protein n=1 Tax=Ciona intestinalis TaxID=7719 RepID=UPI0000523E1B|nr:crk-like protein [Ciona intestinalis]|eukprot:XP_002130797.1 crk-like protein [Ciona intestinalis]
MSVLRSSSMQQQIWYFGSLERIVAEQILQPTSEGTFLVRNSKSILGDFVLSVKQKEEVIHYIIRREHSKLVLKNHVFLSMVTLLEHYKTHFVGEGRLIKPMNKFNCQLWMETQNTEGSSTDWSLFADPTKPSLPPPLPRRDMATMRLPFLVRVSADFVAKNGNQLSCVCNEELEVFEIIDKHWWRARNGLGKMGRVPSTCVEFLTSKVVMEHEEKGKKRKISNFISKKFKSLNTANETMQPHNKYGNPSIRQPIYAKVVKKLKPKPNDRISLQLKVGDIVTIIKIYPNNIMEGIVNTKQGKFPAGHVKVIEEPIEESEEESS